MVKHLFNLTFQSTYKPFRRKYSAYIADAKHRWYTKKTDECIHDIRSETTPTGLSSEPIYAYGGNK
jgi:hypothetical protein